MVVPYAEMGQGALTAVAMLVAEELEVDPTAIRTEMAPGDDKLYGHPILGDQLTGGSLSVRGAWKQMRQAGAATRIVLVAAAAQGWSVDPATCRAEPGHVIHKPSGRRVPYGDLVESAHAIPVPQDPPLKKGKLRIIGQPLHRFDAAEKVNGSAIYGIDVRMPGLRFAALMLSPVIGGKLVDVDPAPALAIRGVSQVVKHPQALAVVASNTGAARKALAALSPRWDDGAQATLSTAGSRRRPRRRNERGRTGRDLGRRCRGGDVQSEEGSRIFLPHADAGTCGDGAVELHNPLSAGCLRNLGRQPRPRTGAPAGRRFPRAVGGCRHRP